MENHKLVLPEHLNHYGYLFGGTLLKWVDEISYIAATLDFPGCNFVTIGMDRVEFRKSVKLGSILRFDASQVRLGNSSVEYGVSVFREDIVTGTGELIFSTRITFVSIDEEGRKKKITCKRS